MHAGYKCFVHKTSTLQKISLFVTVKVHRKSTKKPSQIRITDGRNPLVSVDKDLINNTILPTRPPLTLIFDSETSS